MPRLPIDYSRTIIYKIVCNDLAVTDCYIGSTTDFTNRKREHKHACNISTKTNYNLKVYQTIRANGGWENWSMIEIEKYSCKDHNEATARERYWYEILKANLNMVYPNRNNLEREHTEKYKESRKAWRETNKDEISKKQKEYSEHNKEKIAERHKNYYHNTRKTQVNIPVLCECGCMILKYEKPRHIKTKKHLEKISSNSINAQCLDSTCDGL